MRQLTSPIATAIDQGKAVITSELTPPIGSDLEETLARGREVRDLVDANA